MHLHINGHKVSQEGSHLGEAFLVSLHQVKSCWVSQSYLYYYSYILLAYIEGACSPGLSLFGCCTTRSLSYSFPLCQVQFQLVLGLPDLVPTQASSNSVLLPGYLPLLPTPIFFLFSCLTSRSQFRYACLLISFPTSCTWGWRALVS